MTSPKASRELRNEFVSHLIEAVDGEVRTDRATRILYSTDASIYQIEPLGVFFPRNRADISACVELANEYNISILPRGSGTSLAGQAIGPGLILDCSRHLDKIIDIDPEARVALVEPGVILSTLNQSVEKYGLQFGPDPASAERATMGGVIGNNATGAHSIRFGMSADHVQSLTMILSDGSIAKFQSVGLADARKIAEQSSNEGKIYQAAITIKSDYAKAIQEDWPQTWRRSSGYNLNYLLPWSPARPPQWKAEQLDQSSEIHSYPPIKTDELNLAQLITGSEGTLGIIDQAKVGLVPKPKYTNLVLLAFPDVISACEAVEGILELQPAAVELIPENMLRLASNIPFYAQKIEFLKQVFIDGSNLPNLLAVEFAGDNPDLLNKQANNLVHLNSSIAFNIEDSALQNRIWSVRKVGLGLLMSISGDVKPIPFIEDLSVPVNKLSIFVAELEKIMMAHGSKGDFYAHASAGCLHLRPLINLKSGDGVEKMRNIAREAMGLVISLGGVPSGEHGDGIARSEWLDSVFGPRIGGASKMLKNAADPRGILNPGKILEPLSMDENLRYGRDYSAKSWQTLLDFSKQDGFTGAIELCNGAGVCRKNDGVMCPSFQATREEMHSTRGRANLLREIITDNGHDDLITTDEVVFEALDLCLACKGCKAECPSGVDMAKLKYEFLERHYSSRDHRHPARDYLFGYIDKISRFGKNIRPISNYFLKNINQFKFVGRLFGLSPKRDLPLLASRNLHTLFKQFSSKNKKGMSTTEKVLFLSDPYTEYYRPELGMAAINALSKAGYQIEIIPVIGSGRTLLSKGFVTSARNHAENLVASIMAADENACIIGIEPSEIYTLRDEYIDFFPGRTEVKSIASRAYMVDEFLIRPNKDGKLRYLRIADRLDRVNIDEHEILLHGHCYQKSQPPARDGYPIGINATIELLEGVDFRVELIDSGCCGMAGAFGYEDEHFELSMKIGDLSLFPQIRDKSDTTIIATSGFSCMTQIKDGTGVEAAHPISLIHERLSASS
jgi:FAD/FMN-containing dehydrogenase/Fe-S oxidoreductase